MRFIGGASALLAVVLAAGCDPEEPGPRQNVGDSRCAIQTGCGQAPTMCAAYLVGGPDPVPEALPAYAYSPDDLRERAVGTWSGRFPGSDYAEAFTFTLTVSDGDSDDRSDHDALGYPLNAEDTLADADAGDADAGASRPGFNVCEYVQARASIELSADDDRIHLETDAVRAHGTRLATEALTASSIDAPGGLDGQAMVSLTRNDGDHFTTFAFVFGVDGALWLSVYESNEGYEFVRAGELD